jgi:hypothetical protein
MFRSDVKSACCLHHRTFPKVWRMGMDTTWTARSIQRSSCKRDNEPRWLLSFYEDVQSWPSKIFSIIVVVAIDCDRRHGICKMLSGQLWISSFKVLARYAHATLVHLQLVSSREMSQPIMILYLCTWYLVTSTHIVHCQLCLRNWCSASALQEVGE